MKIKKIHPKNVKVKTAVKSNDTTELVFILDRSGSMAGLEEDTIGGFNAMLEKQKKDSFDEALKRVFSASAPHIKVYEHNKKNEKMNIEDENVTGWIINLVKGHIEWLKDKIGDQLSNGQIYGGELSKAEEALAWLEKQGEQKPVEWSEEDAVMLNDCICAINAANEVDYSISEKERLTNFLNSLRPQHKQEWSERDKK